MIALLLRRNVSSKNGKIEGFALSQEFVTLGFPKLNSLAVIRATAQTRLGSGGKRMKSV